MEVNKDINSSNFINFRLNFILRYGQSIILLLIIASFFAINMYNYPELLRGNVIIRKVSSGPNLLKDNFRQNSSDIYSGKMTIDSSIARKIVIGSELLINTGNGLTFEPLRGKVDSIVSFSGANCCFVYLTIIDFSGNLKNNGPEDVTIGVTEIETGRTSLFKKLFKDITDKFTIN